MRGLKELLWPELLEQVINWPDDVWTRVTEVRLRRDSPVLLRLAGEREIFIRPSETEEVLQSDHLQHVLQKVSRHSPYAFEEELKQGFITMEQGIRVGLVGQAVVENGAVLSLRALQGMNLRVAREVKGCAHLLMNYIFDEQGNLLNTLILSPPGCGKTTLLRDTVRQLSLGLASRPFQVGVVDERSEIAASCEGKVMMELGPRTDVLDRCPKALGMMMMIRSMAPDVLVTDELGRKEDVAAVMESLHAGVSVITTAHGRSLKDLQCRPYLNKLYKKRVFDRIILLASKPRIGFIHTIWSGRDFAVLYEGDEKQNDSETSRLQPDFISRNLAWVRLCPHL